MQKVIEDYVLYEVVGSGQYGKVHRAIHRKTNQTYAVKVIPISKFNQVPKLEEFTANEIRILSRIKNPNVIGFIEMLKTANNMYLVYEFCGDGTLEDVITRRGKVPEQEALYLFQQLLSAFRALYKENILHRDLKPTNILFQKGILKVADFGFCKRMQSQSALTLTMVGSPIYMAPEILKGYPYNTKSDIWSIGVVLYETLFGVCPYEDRTLAGLIQKIDRRKLVIPKEKNPISSNTETLLKKLLTIDPAQRIDWQSLLNYDLQLPSQGPSPSLESKETNLALLTKGGESHLNKENSREIIKENFSSANNNTKVGTNNNLAILSENTKLLNAFSNFPPVEQKNNMHRQPDPNSYKIQSKEQYNITTAVFQVLENPPQPLLENKSPTQQFATPTIIEKPVEVANDQGLDVVFDDILSAILLERNKAIFATSVLRSFLAQNPENKEHCLFLIAKRANHIFRTLLQEIAVDNSNSKYKKFENWEMFRSTDEYVVLSSFLNEEAEEAASLYGAMRASVGPVVEKNETIDHTVKAAVKKEVESNELDLLVYCKQLVAYAEELKFKAHESIKKRFDDQESLRILLHANEILDVAGVDEFANKNLSGSVNWSESEYFKNVKRYSKERLSDLITVKVSSLRAKLILSS